MLRSIGCRAHDYGKDTIENLATQIHDHGYQSIQLALMKALSDIQNIDEGLAVSYAEKIHDRLKEQSIDISVLGAYLNYATLDDMTLEHNIDILEQHISLAPTIGCRMVGTETGSLDESYGPHKNNHGDIAFERFRNAIMRALHVAEKVHTFVGVEAVAHHIIHTPERMKQFVEQLNHPSLKVICDITNMITLENYKEQDQMINQMFDLMEEEILVVHIKDFKFEDGKKIIVPLGKGLLNMSLLAKRIKESPMAIDVLAENVRKTDLKGMFWLIEDYFES